MSVYVDDIRHYPATPLRHKYWCHMVADSHEELEVMARSIGMRPSWIQKPGTLREHYDLTPSMREAAIKRGAIPITNRQMARKTSVKIDKAHVGEARAS